METRRRTGSACAGGLGCGESRRADGAGRRAFTLVELLVVIGIISMLCGILVPVVGKARAHARRNHAGTMSSVERLNLVLQYLDPYTRVKMRKHIPALLVRMKERGIQAGYPL